MRVLFVPTASAGHYFPMVPLAWALRTAGHEVRVACQPSIANLVEASGHIAVPVGESADFAAMLKEADAKIRQRLGALPTSFETVVTMDPEAREWYRELRRAPHVKVAEAMADELVEFGRTWRPDIVVTDPVTMVAPLLAEVVGAPLVHHMWGPQEPSLTRFAGYGRVVEEWPEDLCKLYDRFGAGMRADYSPFSIAPCPPSLQPAPVARRQPIRYVPYNGSAALPDFLRVRGSGRPRVCVSWSTFRGLKVATDQHPVAAIATALTDALDVEVVATVTAADRSRVGPVPGRAQIVADLPLHAVLPTCALAVHSGGAGSTLTAVVHGLPQVIVPAGSAHVFNGERVAALGAGVCLDPDGLDPDDLTAAVSAMLSDERFSHAAKELERENLAQPPVSEAVRLLEELM